MPRQDQDPPDPFDAHAALELATTRDLEALIERIQDLRHSAETALRLNGHKRHVVLAELFTDADKVERVVARLRARARHVPQELPLVQPRIDVRRLAAELAAHAAEERMTVVQLRALLGPYGLTVRETEAGHALVEWFPFSDPEAGFGQIRLVVVALRLWTLFSEKNPIYDRTAGLTAIHAALCSQLAELDGVLLEEPRSNW